MKEVMENIRKYLMHWDPIGCIPSQIEDGYPATEYDSYAGPIYTLLSSGASIEDISEHLSKIRVNHMGLKKNSSADKAMAKSLHTYFHKWSGFKK